MGYMEMAGTFSAKQHLQDNKTHILLAASGILPYGFPSHYQITF